MSGDTHASAGLAIGLITNVIGGQVFNFPAVAGLCWSVVGSLFPDLDLRNSRGNKLLAKVLPWFLAALLLLVGAYRLGKVSIGSIIGGKVIGAMLVIGLAFFCKTRPHREFSHSLFSTGIGTLGVFLCAGKWSSFMFLIGYLSHLCLDLLNLKGESLLYPNKKKFCLKLCTSTGIVNRIIEVVCGCVSVILIVGGIL